MTEPKPREGVYDLYWNFAHKRQSAFRKRLGGGARPWSDDPVIREYKFCNVYRATDRVSQYLIRQIAYSADNCPPADRLFRLVAFRFFSRIETWEGLHAILGRQPLIADLSDGSLVRALDTISKAGGPLYTGAFILCAANPYGKSRKYENHAELFRHMFVLHRIANDILEAQCLGQVFRLLRAYPLMGDFMSYQVAIDLNYSSLVNFSENDFTCPGPGAVRGLKKVFEHLGEYSPSDAIKWMVDQQDEEFRRLGHEFPGLWGRNLHAIDCQGLFCEVDKYCRVAAPELLSGRKRIKAKFNPLPQLPELFLPPKWNLNEKIQRDTAGHLTTPPDEQDQPFELIA